MFGSHVWFLAPFLYIPARGIYVALRMWFEGSRAYKNLSEKYPQRIRSIRRIFRGIFACVAYVITVLFILAFEYLTGIDLLDYGAL